MPTRTVPSRGPSGFTFLHLVITIAAVTVLALAALAIYNKVKTTKVPPPTGYQSSVNICAVLVQDLKPAGSPMVGTLSGTGVLPAFITLNGDKLEAKPQGNDFGSYSFSIHDAVGKVMDLTMDVPRPTPPPTFSPSSGMTLTFAGATSNDVDVTITPACTYTVASAIFINTPAHWNQAQVSIVQQFPLATDARGHLTVSARSSAGISTGTATLELIVQSNKPGEPPIKIDIPVKLE